MLLLRSGPLSRLCGPVQGESTDHVACADPRETADSNLHAVDPGEESVLASGRTTSVDRNIEFTLGYHIDERVRDGVMGVPTGCWHPAVDADGQRRDGADVVELTDFMNLDAWPTGTRRIVRRERPHPGAQLSLFDTIEEIRHTAFITNTRGHDPRRKSNRARQPAFR